MIKFFNFLTSLVKYKESNTLELLPALTTEWWKCNSRSWKSTFL